jgi:hypothetical protein
MRQALSKDKRTLRRSLKAFLHLRSKAHPATKYCADCGTVCTHLVAQFWLDGDAEAFSIPLPFCPRCNPELLSRAPAVA